MQADRTLGTEKHRRTLPMTLAEALIQLRVWCDRSRGEPIEIAPGVTGSFQSRGTSSEAEVIEIEAELGCTLPLSYRAFMASVGESSLFGWSPAGGHWHFYHPRQVIEVSQEWAVAQPEVERFCFVGEHRCMGDMMGFCIDHPSPRNFDIYCHEYPFQDYVAVSDEINSWREFEPYIVGVVSRFGRDSL
jgi:hypothetical protein